MKSRNSTGAGLGRRSPRMPDAGEEARPLGVAARALALGHRVGQRHQALHAVRQAAAVDVDVALLGELGEVGEKDQQGAVPGAELAGLEGDPLAVPASPPSSLAMPSGSGTPPLIRHGPARRTTSWSADGRSKASSAAGIVVWRCTMALALPRAALWRCEQALRTRRPGSLRADRRGCACRRTRSQRPGDALRRASAARRSARRRTSAPSSRPARRPRGGCWDSRGCRSMRAGMAGSDHRLEPGIGTALEREHLLDAVRRQGDRGRRGRAVPRGRSCRWR